MLEALLELHADIFVFRHQLRGQHDEIAEINGVRLTQCILIDFVDFADFDRFLGSLDFVRRRICKRGPRLGQIVLRRDQLILAARDCLQDVDQLVGGLEQVLIMAQRKAREVRFQKRELGSLIENFDVGRASETARPFGDHLQAEAVECPDPHLDRRVPMGVGKPLTHLLSSLFREGECQDRT